MAMYHGELLTHESVRSRTLRQLPVVQSSSGDASLEDLADTTLLLVDTAGCDMYETVNAAGSRFNEGEANIVSQHVRRLISIGLQQNQLAIITPYNGQVELLRSLLLPDFPKLEIRSVDGFQGGERDAVVLSLVRSSDRGGKNGIGFLRDDRRQNVAVTRAKRHLAVICDSETVAQSKFISTLISWIGEHGEQRSAIEYLSGSTDSIDEQDLRAAEMELMKIVESSFAAPDKDMGSSSTQGQAKKDHDDRLDGVKRKALMDTINSFAETGSSGEEMILSTELSGFDRRLVHEFAEHVGLGHRSEGIDGVDRRIILTIEKKQVFANVAVAEKQLEEDAFEPPAAAPVVSLFSALSIDDSDSDPSDLEAEATKPANDSPANPSFAELAKERAERQNNVVPSKPTTSITSGKKNNKTKKSKQQKLGGKKKEAKPEEKLDDLDDMAFLDAQIDTAQNAHGRKVGGSGKGYRTIVNGILNASPDPRPTPTNTRAAASLQSKLQGAQNARRSKNKKNKK
jgi:ATP-dependent RNA/DNA helicase IGHMBP2